MKKYFSYSKYRLIIVPTKKDIMPIEPKKWSGFFEYLIRNFIVNKSKNPFNNLEKPYLLLPCNLL